MAKKGENIYLRKDGRWEGRYIKGRKADGKPIFCSIYGKSYNEVKKQLIIIKSTLYRHEDPKRIWAHSKTMADWLEYWLETLIRPNIKANTYLGYRRSIEKHIFPLMGQQEIRKLTAHTIQMAANTLAERLAPGTLHGVSTKARQTFLPVEME